MREPDLPPISQLADMARLKVNDDEKERLEDQLHKIVGYFRTLAAIDTDGVAATPYAVDLESVVRADAPTEGSVALPSGPALVQTNAPAREGSFYRVPPILEG